MKAGLVVLGIIFMVGMFLFSNVIITPQQKQEVKLVNSLCNVNVGLFGFDIPIGQAAQALSPEATEQCQQYSLISKIISYEMYVYIIGFVILVLGLALGGGGKTIIREVVKESHEKVEDEEEPEEETEEEPKIKKGKLKTKYCSNCGTKLKVGHKFCGKCGKGAKK